MSLVCVFVAAGGDPAEESRREDAARPADRGVSRRPLRLVHLLSVAYFLITHFDLLLICFTYMLTLSCIFRSPDGCIDGDDLKGTKEPELRSV